MTSKYERELQVGLQAVSAAAKLCGAVQAGLTARVLEKNDRSPVTVADFGSQALICAALHEAFPGDPIIGEEDATALKAPRNAAILGEVLAQVKKARPDADESAVCAWIDRGHTRQYCERFWTLDPIDGTQGFLRKEQYAIALSLIVAGTIEIGILGCPNLAAQTEDSQVGALFFARRGGGAFVQAMSAMSDDQKSSQPTLVPVHVSAQQDPAQLRFCESVEAAHSSHGDAARLAERLRISLPPLRLDSQAKYAVLSRGDADVYLRMPTRADYREKIWDHAAGVLIVCEAGGKVTDLDGRPLEFTHGATLAKNRGILASNSRLHPALLSALSVGTG